MKTKVLITMLLLLVCAAIFANEDSGDPAEQWRKTQELNERAERFKAETGFEGYIGYSLQSVQFSTISGNFMDIEVTAPQDTVFMRNVFDQVVSKVLPYIAAREGQLSSGRVSSNIHGTGIIYWQKVNGYSIEGGGGTLRIHYSLATRQLSVNNGTADISSDPISINLSLEQAINLVQEKVFDGAEVKPTNPRIAYVPIDNENGQVYCLCYVLTNQGYTVFVDVSEPIIRKVAPNRILRSFNVNVLGNVYSKVYADTINITLSQQSMGSVLVQTPIDSLYADYFGQQTVSDSIYTWLKTELRNHEVFHVVQYPDTMTVVQQDSVSVSGSQLVSFFYDNNAKTANAYYHAHHQQQFLNELVADEMLQPWMLNITTNYPYASGGDIDINGNTIRISYNSGKLSHVVRHELSHANMYSVLNNLFNDTDDDTKDAMDEAFAVYLQCAAIESPYCLYGNPQDPQRIDIMNHISSVTPPNLNETAYEDYDVRHTIASAWWDIRDKIGDYQFDQYLIDRVKFDVDGTNDMKYKPRYFYNILMRNSTTANQEIIDKAYSDRGLHFTPRVISAGSNNPHKEKNKFRIGDPVHVKITNCPQNTPLTIYIVEDQDYTDGMNISTLNSIICQVSGTSDNDGVWHSNTPVMIASQGGEYDILVDIGNNGVLHFAYSGANIRDGFDGLTGHGFTVYDDRIEVVTRDLPSISHR